MTNNIENRPDDCFYKGLWDLYVKLKSLKDPYIKTKGYLFHIEDIDFTIGEKDYYFDGIASIDIPYHKETLTVSLKRLEYNTEIREECRIERNTRYDYEHDVDWYIKTFDLNIPEALELDSAELKNGIPVTYINKTPVRTRNRSRSFLPSNRAKTFISTIKYYLDKNKISYKHDKEDDIPHITMIFDAPERTDKILTGILLFKENHAEYKLTYTDKRKFMPKEPTHPDRLLRLLNHINENVFVEQEESGHKDRKHVYYTPRIYVNYGDNLTITAKTMIDYNIWRRIPETYDYIVKDCPAMLFSITYLIAAVYAGVISSKLAIEEIDSWNK